MVTLPLHGTIKDLLIIAASIILVGCIRQIRKLKRSIAQEIHRRLLPQLSLEFISDKDNPQAGLHLKNESFFLAKEIRIEDVDLSLEDFGLKIEYILRFEPVDFLKPQERVKLKFGVFDRSGQPLAEITEKIIPHLVRASFRIVVRYSNIENLKFRVVFLKKRDKFFAERVEYSQ